MLHKLILSFSLLILVFACQTDKAVEKDIEGMVDELINSQVFLEYAPLLKSVERESLIGLRSGGRLIKHEEIEASLQNVEQLKTIYQAANYPNAEELATLKVELEKKRIAIYPVAENLVKELTKEEKTEFEALINEKAEHMMKLSASEALTLPNIKRD